MGTKIKGQYVNRSIFRMIKYMNGSFFSKARYMNGIGFEILARTPVPKLPPNYPHPAPRLGEVETGSAVVGGGGLKPVLFARNLTLKSIAAPNYNI